jgi:pantoate--beta-alanine ligase
LVFNPTAEEMYGQGFQSYVEVTEVSQELCGASRPGHFRGVTTVVSKLFNIIQPDRAYFGEKDAQQLRVIQRMVRDLNFPIEIRPAPTVREEDGLAKSSRNTYLSPEERRAAVVLSKSLFFAKEQVAAGENNVQLISDQMKEMIGAEPLVSLEYLEFRESATLKPVSTIAGEILIALAARVGKTRLIDNLAVQPERG